MDGARVGVAIAAGALAVALTGTAVAAPAGRAAVASRPPATATGIATTSWSAAPSVFVDSRGTVNVAWVADTPGGHPTVRYARMPAHARTFTQVRLPAASDDADPFLYQPSPGILQIIVTSQTGQGALRAWRSRTDGRSWTTMNTSQLNSPALRSHGVYLTSQGLVDAPGGPIEYAGAEGAPGPVVTFNAALTDVRTIATNAGSLYDVQVARTRSGTTFQLGATNTMHLPFQAGEITGTAFFPTCGGDSTTDLAAGLTTAVVAKAGCGHVWTRTITAGGVVGRLVSIGKAPTGGFGSDGAPWVDIVTDSRGSFTAAFVTQGGDLRIARSATGSRWRTLPGWVPTATELGSLDGAQGEVSAGAPTWYGSATAVSPTAYEVEALPLSDTYRPPGAPSARGIPDPRRARLGSLAVTVPGEVPVARLQANGRLTVRLVEAVAGRVTITVSVNRKRRSTTYTICSGGSVLRLRAHRARTVTATCSSDGIATPAVTTPAATVPARRGDTVTYTFTARNGTLTVSGRVV
jgi:hypothetical protein